MMDENVNLLLDGLSAQLDELEGHLAASIIAASQSTMIEAAAQQFANYYVYGRCVISEAFMTRVAEIVAASGKPLSSFDSVLETGND